MLTSLEIENFKGIAGRQRIDFAQLTLLFGPNSAGKSTILHALIYLHELLERGNADVDRTELGGAVLELGGFSRLVHRHDLNRRIVLRVEFDTPGSLDKFERDLTDFPLVDLEDEIKSAWMEVTIRYATTPVFRGPLAECVEIGVGGDRRALVRLETRGLRERDPLSVQVNFDHPLLSSVEEAVAEAWRNIAEMPGNSPDRDEAPSEEGGAPQSGSPGAPSDLVNWLRQPTYAVSRSRPSALPAIGEPLSVIDLGDTDVVRSTFVLVNTRLEEGVAEHRDLTKNARDLLLEEILRRERSLVEVRTFLEMVIVGTIAQLAKSLREAIYIGPLRTVPPRGFLYQRAGRISSWADGLAAWDLLLADSPTLVDETNDWLRRLGADCKVRVQQLYDSSASAEELSGGHVDKTARRLMLDVGGESLVLPSEVGAGVSQVMPVVVAALEKRPGLTLVEQPEIHVHPAMQVGLGDLFIEAVTRDSRRTVLIETHSEHVILRLLRRIRETTEEELPDGAPSLTADKVSVLYIESLPEGALIRRLRVDEHGEFKDRWPRGFFEERAGELF